MANEVNDSVVEITTKCRIGVIKIASWNRGGIFTWFCTFNHVSVIYVLEVARDVKLRGLV